MLLTFARSIAIALLASSSAGAQSFLIEPTWIPTGVGIDSPSADVDFGDCDLDGDWDIAYACGSTLGFPSPDDCRIFVNVGGSQSGAPGHYTDETAARFPTHFVDANDIEWVDIDDDGDPDLHITTDARFFNHGAKWFVNRGGEQGGQLGYFTNETASRWLGLGTPGSSVPSSFVVAGGGFIDYGYDGSFADLDQDGDLDLFHTTIGSPADSLSNFTPSRVFLNDGDGHFVELNPSAVVAANGKLALGQPAVWASGGFQPDTLAVDGSSADVAMTCRESDLADLDADFDIDIVSADQERSPRVFVNQLADAGNLGFVDKTGAMSPFGVILGSGQVSQTLADLDLDGDVDLVLVLSTSGSNVDDCLLTNDGLGVFSVQQYLGPITFDWEVDTIDVDNDGRLDLVFSEVYSSAPSRVRANVVGGSFPIEALHLDTGRSGDADACDVDLDGDFDLVFVDWYIGPLRLMRNITELSDAIAPAIVAVETLAARSSSSGEVSIGCTVRENAPVDLDGAVQLAAQCKVEGWTLPGIASSSCGAGTWLTRLPANLVGTAEYQFLATDGHGNSAASTAKTTSFSTSLAFSNSYGAASTLAAFGGSPVLQPLSVPFADSTLYLGASCGAPAGTPVLFAIGTQMTAPLAIPGLLTANVLPPLAVLRWKVLDAAGKATLDAEVPAGASGIAVYAQCLVLAPSQAGELFTGSAGLQLVIQ